MRISTTSLTLAVTAAFVAGLAASPLTRHAIPDARAQGTPLTAMMIDLAALKHDDLAKAFLGDVAAVAKK